MLEGLLFAIAIFMMTAGIIALIFCCISKLMNPKRREKYYVILPLYEDSEPSALISSALEKRNLLGETPYCEIIAVNCGLSHETFTFLVNLYGKNHMFSLVSPTDMLSLLTFK